MMAAFRRFYKSWAAKVLFGLLAVSFVVWGASSRTFNLQLSDTVVKAGSREINSTDFKQRFDEVLQRAEQQSGQAITAEQAAQAGLLQQSLDNMATEEAVLEAIKRNGVQASDQLVVDQIRKIPAFFNPVTGAFDEDTYERLLAQKKLTPVMFQQDLRDQLSLLEFSSAMGGALKAPATYAVVFAAIDQQSRAADYFELDPRSQPTPATPTDAQLNQFIKAHAAQLSAPETRQITLVRISAADIAGGLKPSDADVQKMFNIEKARLSTPERRSFVEIQAKDPAMASAIAARLTKGEDPAKIAASYGGKPISYADTPQSVVSDPSVGKAVFALQPGQVSGPIQGQFGLAVAKLINITPAKPETLDEARPQIEKDLNDKTAKDTAYDQSEKYSDAHNKGQNMDAAVKASGAKVFPIPVPFDAQGKMPDGQPLQNLNEKMVKDAYSLPQGGETDITDLGQGEYYAIRVDKITPAHLRTLDEIRAPITRAYMTNQLIQGMKTKADGLLARVKKGEAMAAVAASAGATVQHLQLTRADAQQQQQTLGRDILGNLFAAKVGDVYEAQAPNYGFAVVKVTSIQPGAVADIAKESQLIRGQLTQDMGGNEFSEMFYTAARAQVKPRINLTLAYQAIGVQPPASSAPAKGAGKAQ